MSELFEAIEAGDPVKVRRLLTSDRLLANTTDNREKKVSSDADLKNGADLKRFRLLAAGGRHPAQRPPLSSTYTALHVAALKSHTEVVRILVEFGADMTAVSGNKWTPLHFAIGATTRTANLELVRFLVANGANVNASDEAPRPPLHMALSQKSRSLEAFELLLASGAEVNARSKDGWTALDYAMFYDHRSDQNAVFKTLIRHGANVNAEPPSFGQSGWLLCRAASHANPEVVRMFIAAGANVNAVSERWGSALHYAAVRGRDEVVEILLNARAKPDLFDHEGHTALDLTKGYTEALEVLEGRRLEPTSGRTDEIDADSVGIAGVNGQPWGCERKLAELAQTEGEYGETYRAIIARDADRLRVLLAADGSPVWIENNGWTPLLAAAALGKRGVAEVLIDRGARLDVPASAFEILPLHVAAKYGNADVVNLLLERGADVSVKDRNGDTALRYSICGNACDLRTVEFLLRAGADPNGRDLEDRTAFQTAICRAKIAVVETMLRFGADVNARQSAHPRTWQESPDEWPLVLEYESARPLYLAACSGSFELVELLLNAGADIDALSFGWSALHAAAAKPDAAMVGFLLARGADREVLSADNRTPIEMLFGHRRCAELLWMALAG